MLLKDFDRAKIEAQSCYEKRECDIDFGILQNFAENCSVTDMVVTEDGRVWVDKGEGLKEKSTRVPLSNPSVLREYSVWLCAQLGKRLDDACPVADASSESGIRIHAVISPIVSKGAALSIRFPALQHYDLATLSDIGMMPKEILLVLEKLVKMRANILITGSTGSGKTTLMKALLSAANAQDRIVSVEEVRELGNIAVHHVSLSVREANVEGAGAVGLPQLVKATLRMRPDRIILGECRGEEIADLLRVFTSGHHGGMTTLHADEVDRVPARLMALGLLAGLKPEALCSLAAGAFDVIIHVQRAIDGKRYIRELGVLQSINGGEVLKGISILRVNKDSKHMSIEIFPEWNVFAKKWGLYKSSNSVCKV